MIPNPFRFIGAVWRAIVAWWNYEPVLVIQKVAEGRRAICFGCAHYQTLTGQCAKCSCFVLVKSLLATEKCPIDRWGPIEVKPPGPVRQTLRRIASALRKRS